jgi:hypothetical protein
MRKIITLFLLSLSFSLISAQNLAFSDSTIVSLITCSPGKVAYERFGHTAIRLNDPVNHIDVVFNYGIFSFNTKNFYIKFIKGETDYQLGVYPTQYFLPEYQERNSMVWESVLNLNLKEKQFLINSLLENYKPENRTYRYNFIYDNCATRPRDKIFNALNGHFDLPKGVETKTYRQWLSIYAGTYSWLNFGLDIAFGMEADNNCPQYESMFLPELLMTELKNTKIENFTTGEHRDLIKSQNIIIDSTHQKESFHWYNNTVVVFMIILIIGLIYTVIEYLKNRHKRFIDTILLAATGIGGFILIFLMLWSTHPLVSKNLNILWLNPLNLFAAVLIWVKGAKKIMLYYQVFNILLLGLALIAFALSFQTFNVAVFPLIVLLLVRYTTGVARLKHKIYKIAKNVLNKF